MTLFHLEGWKSKENLEKNNGKRQKKERGGPLGPNSLSFLSFSIVFSMFSSPFQPSRWKSVIPAEPHLYASPTVARRTTTVRFLISARAHIFRAFCCRAPGNLISAISNLAEAKSENIRKISKICQNPSKKQ